MKRFALLLTPLLLVLSCSKHHANPGNAIPPSDLNKPYSLPAASQANPAYDGSSFGIYKGVAITETETETPKTFGVNIGNNSKAIYALEYEKGLLRDSLIRYAFDTTYIHLLFPPRLDTSVVAPNKKLLALMQSYNLDSVDVLVGININGDGSSPGLYANTQNFYLSAALKERSGNQVFCYIGAYQGAFVVPGAPPDSGRIAFVLNADSVQAMQISIPYYQYFEPGPGAAIVNHQFVIESFDSPGGHSFILTGTVNGNTVSGTWTRTLSNATGTFTAQRTL